MEADVGVNSDSSSFEDLSAQELTNNCNGDDETKNDSNESDEWLDILGSGSLKKKILKAGTAEQRPQRSDICTIRLKGTVLSNGNIIDDYERLKIQIGDLEVIQGIDLVLPLMNIGELALVQIEPRLAYGDEGDLPNVPPNAKIQYEIELLEIEPEQELENIPVLTRKIIGNKKRERGNWWYARNECNYAIQCYRKALDYLDDVEGGITDPTADGNLKPTDADLQDLLEDRMKVYNNMAAAQMKLQMYDAALKCVDNVLMCQPQNVKALFRKAKILTSKNEPEEATAVLRKALAVDPSNTTVQKELQKLISLAQKHRDHERNMAKRMLQQHSSDDSMSSSVNNSNNKQKYKKQRNKFFLLAPLIGGLAIGIAALTAYKFKYD